MAARIRISVVVTNHNYRAYVREAIASALAQSFQPLEVVVVDDGSSDGSVELLKQIYGGAELVKILATENGGQLAAFRAGVSASAGDVVAFLDADDRWKGDHLERLAQIYLNESDAEFAYTNLEMFGERSGRYDLAAKGRRMGMRVLQTYFQHAWIGAPTSALSMRRELAVKILSRLVGHESDWKTRADDCLILGAGVLGAMKYRAPHVTVEYRIHAKNRWFGQARSRSDAIRHMWKVSRMNSALIGALSLHAIPPNAPDQEFKSIERPQWGDLVFHLAMIGKVHTGPWLRFRQRMVVLAYYLSSFIQRRPD